MVNQAKLNVAAPLKTSQDVTTLTVKKLGKHKYTKSTPQLEECDCPWIWWRQPADRARPGQFQFDSTTDSTKTKVIPLKFSDIPDGANLVHATNTDIFLMGRNTFDLPDKTNNTIKSDACPKGFVYCGIKIPERNNQSEPGFEKSLKLKNQQRYGGFVMEWNMKRIIKRLTENNERFFKVGTKFYRKEYSQMILIDRYESKCRTHDTGKIPGWELDLNKSKYTCKTDTDT